MHGARITEIEAGQEGAERTINNHNRGCIHAYYSRVGAKHAATRMPQRSSLSPGFPSYPYCGV